MKIAIFGGGLTGLSAAWYLSQKGHIITVYEGGEKLGGLAQGFQEEGWGWALEKTYHHIFSNDAAILSLAKEIKFDGFTFSRPTTSSLFGERNNYRIFPVDSPKDFLLLPELTLISKLRAGITIAFLKISPFLSFFEKITSSDFLRKTMGEEAWNVLWRQLFRNKYGKYAENILASFIWARISKRTPWLGYPNGGFQKFIDILAENNKGRGVVIKKSTTLIKVKKEGLEYGFITNEDGEEVAGRADAIISTLPYPNTLKTMRGVLGEEYCSMQEKRKYLFAINLILKTNEPILKKTYWLNIGAQDIPIMCIVQHTNFIDKKHYGSKHISYIAWYVDKESELLKKTEKELLSFVSQHIKNITPTLIETPEVVRLFKVPYAQPIFDSDFLTIPQTFATPAKNIYIANLDMTYPYDRGTNYAVQLGKDVSNYFLKNI